MLSVAQERQPVLHFQARWPVQNRLRSPARRLG
jgi:hypothetical protein